MPENNSVLVLEISKQDNHLAMSVIGQEERSQTIKHYSQRALAYSEVNKLCQEITSTLNKVNRKGILESDLINDLKKTGQLLWDHLLTKAAKDRLKNSQTQDLVLAIDEELIDMPWELLYDGRDFLCLKFNLGRQVRTKEHIKPPQYRSVSSTLRMLVLANPTNDLESSYQEGIFIRNQFDRQRKQIKIDFKSTNIDTLYVKRNLRDYDIVHFAGHCEYNPGEPKVIGWVLNDGRFTAHDILALGESLSLPSLVFANACHSARVVNDLMEPDYQEKTYSLAAAFLFSGVRHYIGAIRKIEDPASLVFAKEFYTQLIKGRSMGECVRMGRLKLLEKHGVAAVSWASYILYGDPN
ncbi:MAG: CHAT domain-containing protein, partial [Candidatus Omnitrophica bacterium]|nr:CHAT domain-containing protein [Candidatus Omnitrophota bacterium]